MALGLTRIIRDNLYLMGWQSVAVNLVRVLLIAWWGRLVSVVKGTVIWWLGGGRGDGGLVDLVAGRCSGVEIWWILWRGVVKWMRCW
jgi:hypothetical protein